MERTFVSRHANLPVVGRMKRHFEILGKQTWPIAKKKFAKVNKSHEFLVSWDSVRPILAGCLHKDNTIHYWDFLWFSPAVVECFWINAQEENIKQTMGTHHILHINRTSINTFTRLSFLELCPSLDAMPSVEMISTHAGFLKFISRMSLGFGRVCKFTEYNVLDNQEELQKFWCEFYKMMLFFLSAIQVDEKVFSQFGELGLMRSVTLPFVVHGCHFYDLFFLFLLPL